MAIKTDTQQSSAKTKRKKTKLTSKRIAWCTFFGAAAVATVVAIALPGGGSQITLPQGGVSAQNIVKEEAGYRLTNANISKENVQQVIASLTRPSAYSAAVSNTLYWDGDWKEIQAAQYVRDGICVTQYYNASGAAEQSEAIVGDQYYAWRRDGTQHYQGATGIVSADAAGMIPTYESVIKEDADSITEAGLRTVNGESCIYVTVADTDTEYNLTYWISTVSGLLVQADYTRGSELVRSVVISDVRQEEPASALFALPDGGSLLPQQTEE